MKSSHRGLGITEEEWDTLLRHIGASCDALGVAARERAEIMEASNGLKWDIVEIRPAAAE
jgi:truncated hemoglobin YjbI